MTILQSLKKLHKKMTGQETNSKTIGGVLDSMQENYNGGSSSGSDDTYETVAEIAVGTMSPGGMSGIPAAWFYKLTSTEDFEFADGETFYFNDATNQSDSILIIPGVSKLLLFNCEVRENELVVIREGKPSYVVINDDDKNDIAIASSENISNSIVTILKKVSDDSDNEFVVHGTLVIDQTTDPITVRVKNIKEQYSDIVAAMLAGKNVRLVAVDELTDAFCGLPGFYSPGIGGVLFSGVVYMPGGLNLAIVTITENELGETVAEVDALLLEHADMSPIIVPGTVDTVQGTAVSTLGVPLETIYNAFASGRSIYFEAEINQARCRLPAISVSMETGGTYVIVYSAPSLTGAAHVMFAGDNNNGTYIQSA